MFRLSVFVWIAVHPKATNENLWYASDIKRAAYKCLAPNSTILIALITFVPSMYMTMPPDRIYCSSLLVGWVDPSMQEGVHGICILVAKNGSATKCVLRGYEIKIRCRGLYLWSLNGNLSVYVNNWHDKLKVNGELKKIPSIRACLENEWDALYQEKVALWVYQRMCLYCSHIALHERRCIILESSVRLLLLVFAVRAHPCTFGLP
jgi:hypothetical protein